MKKPKAIFFDNDGVLVGTEEFFCRANTEALAKMFPEKRISHTEKDFKQYVVLTNEGSTGWLKRKGLTDEEVLIFRECRDGVYTSMLKAGDCSIDDAYSVLKSSSSKFRLGLTTASRRKHFEYVHRNTGMREFFEFEITREDTKILKPNPEIYLLALSRANLNPDEAVVIEDTPRGVAAGKAAGIFTIAIPHAFTKELDFSAADVVLESIAELPDFLDNLEE